MSPGTPGNERWLQVWEVGKIPFHLPAINPFIKEYIHHLIAEQPSPHPYRVLVPLCGKTVDMLFLYNMGLSVVGIELSPIACEAFFTENNLSVNKESHEGFNVWRHDERLVIFECDLFKITADIIGGLCELNWDCGSFVALPMTMQADYATHITTLLSDKSKSLLECFEYDTSKRQPPPNCILFDSVTAAFGDRFEYKEISRVDDSELEIKRLDGVTHVLYLLTRK